nr:VOC family protein [Oceanicaulis sp. MMSF_3324]
MTVGTNDLEKAAVFYDRIAALLDTPRMMEDPGNFIAWGKPDGGAGIGLTKPFNGEPATVGNGVMVALGARDEAHVDEIYKAAMELGGTCEGEPGWRGDQFYAAYFRDLDGNKLNAFIMKMD